MAKLLDWAKAQRCADGCFKSFIVINRGDSAGTYHGNKVRAGEVQAIVYCRKFPWQYINVFLGTPLGGIEPRPTPRADG